MVTLHEDLRGESPTTVQLRGESPVMTSSPSRPTRILLTRDYTDVTSAIRKGQRAYSGERANLFSLSMTKCKCIFLNLGSNFSL
jgi:hypothetical protein